MKHDSLFQSFTLPASGIQLKNRVVMAPMTNSASHENGDVSDDELAYYRERSGGVGAVITAVANVTEDGIGFDGEVGVYDDRHIEGLTRLADTIHAEGAKAILQVFHAGRLAPLHLLKGGSPISASAIAHTDMEGKDLPVPREMTTEDIQRVIQAFGEATRRAIKAGFDGIEIHGANRYLIQQFFSPYTNRREDQWGGSLEKRIAFPLAVVAEVKRAVKEHAQRPFIIGYRISPEEHYEPGITIEDSLYLVDRIADESIDYIHLSTMNFFEGSIRDQNDTRLPTVRVHEKVGDRVAVIGVGSIHTPEEAARALDTGVPLIALGRQLLVEPHWVEKVQGGREGEIRQAISRQAGRETLVMPAPLWNMVTNAPGWVPVED
ncbi:NADH-dependent flavin oxidoreductase [Paenibacillus sp. P96]|uniref:NADH-dependent flavin oxidoreductase n=1 Tax=Paenibacillus zeirhizosphaerae TaxID=2987519 RepID=A0ABT9FP57_9BACL|nr:NADH-dependent flavin oxidoreductase [Paenibacillus sp. P96]MDP4096177.1 NADH-dependent flavin oxidoreductase [Paenibacillus sp. P96]